MEQERQINSYKFIDLSQMKNNVKNELIVQHDTIICDPFSVELSPDKA